MLPGKIDLCPHGNVSAWLYHSKVEINSLLRFQFSLNEKLSSKCKSSLTSHMCSFGLQCFSKMSVYTKTYLEDIIKSCKTAVKDWWVFVLIILRWIELLLLVNHKEYLTPISWKCKLLCTPNFLAQQEVCTFKSNH